jgi:hypothetical protein
MSLDERDLYNALLVWAALLLVTAKQADTIGARKHFERYIVILIEQQSKP